MGRIQATIAACTALEKKLVGDVLKSAMSPFAGAYREQVPLTKEDKKWTQAQLSVL